MKSERIVFFSGCDHTSSIVYNELIKEFDIVAVIMEAPSSFSARVKERIRFLSRRKKKLGLWTVLGQIMFTVFVSMPMAFCSKKRIEEIIDNNHLSSYPVPEDKRVYVSSFNSDETVQKLQCLMPDVVVVNGTRIIAERIINCIPCSFINTHLGITPKYRGVHGMYWALANQDIEHSGVTVHFIDKGIDTGNVIYQAKVVPTPNDNFVTYVYLQIAEGVKILKKALRDYFDDSITPDIPPQESRLYTHPTLWSYLSTRIRVGIK